MGYIDQIIMGCAGIWMTAAGFGYFRTDTAIPWIASLIGHFRWMGPLLIVCAVALVFAPR